MLYIYEMKPNGQFPTIFLVQDFFKTCLWRVAPPPTLIFHFYTKTETSKAKAQGLFVPP